MDWRSLLTDEQTLSNFAFFIVLVLGYLLGRIGIGSFRLGPVPGVLLAGLVFGHFGLTMANSAQEFGFSLFIFSVGYQAGPRFVDVVRRDGMRFFLLALVIAVTGFALAIGLTKYFELEFGSAAGILGGAMTTTPVLAAAEGAVRNGSVTLPDGVTMLEATTNITTSYAVTYLFGVIGLILLIKLWPRILGIDLVAEAAKLEGSQPAHASDSPALSIRAYRLEADDPDDETVLEAENAYLGRALLLRLQRDGELIEVDKDTRVMLGDEFVVMGDQRFFAEIDKSLVREIYDKELLNVRTEVARIAVTNNDFIGERYAELRKVTRLGGLTTGVRRMGVDLPIDDHLVLKRGDVLTWVAPSEIIDRWAATIGVVERGVDETDLMTFALGVASGILLGKLSIDVFGISLSLGAAGGLLVSGLVIGYLRSLHPIFGRVPSASRWLLMELGMLMFMAGVGLKAGAGVVETLVEAGPQLMVAGMIITTVPFLAGWFFGSKVLGMNPAFLLGGIAGAMTSGSALKVVTEAAKSESPALGYTGAYAFANIILTMAGSLILYFTL
ncbi:MAG: aspartate:alanine exchanger family transporter [Gammaproteobacteria bacterium]